MSFSSFNSNNCSNVLHTAKRSVFVGVFMFFVLLTFAPLKSYCQEYSDGFVTALVSYKKVASPGEVIPLNIIIIKNSVSGFSKFQGLFPSGMQVMCPNIENAACSFKDNVLKIIWISIPTEQFFDINLQILISPNSPFAQHDFSVTFFYLLNNEIKQVKLDQLSVLVSKDSQKISKANDDFARQTDSLSKRHKIVQPTFSSSENQQDIKQDTSKVDSTYKQIVAFNREIAGGEANTKKKKKEKQPKQAIQNTPSDEQQTKESNNQQLDNVVFKVQIAASRNTLDMSKLKDYYKGSLDIIEEVHPDGWHRYTIGQCNTYEEAHKIKLQCGVADAFISATNAGKIVPLVDALRQTVDRTDSTENVFYAVQIKAVKRYMSIRRLSRKHDIDKIVFIEKADGLYKYLVGYFFTYNEANEFRTKVTVPDAFIVAFSNGKRIEVNQAKMITDKEQFQK